MTQDIPPPFPPAGDEDATHFVSAMESPPPFPDGPVPPEDSTHTHEQLAMPAAVESGTDVGPAGRQRRRTADARIREPAPARRRPSLLPNADAGRQVRGPDTVRPGVINPVKPRQGGGRGFGEASRESSDVISSFQHPSGEAPAVPQPIKTEGRARLRPRRPKRPPPSVQPSRQRSAPPRQTYNPPQRPAPPPMLPLNQEQLGMLIADQRRRLHVLYGFARGLEIAAGVLGTLSLAVLIASVVSILVGGGATVLSSASALAGSATGLALTLIMVVAAAAMRQLAHVSAQLAALIEALCRPPST